LEPGWRDGTAFFALDLEISRERFGGRMAAAQFRCH
jgi:hypothetical protein